MEEGWVSPEPGMEPAPPGYLNILSQSLVNTGQSLVAGSYLEFRLLEYSLARLGEHGPVTGGWVAP